MDKEIQKGLSDRLYDKRKLAALELERAIRECLAENNREKISEIIDQLVRDFAYAVHHPNARNGGLIGLAAAAIALGPNEVPLYLEDIIHPVLACFGDQDARVRYYACESLYNIAKVAKGEILLYFNEIFDVLCKLSTDSEPSVKNGADLLDRLVKDIVAEKAAVYTSVITKNEPPVLSSVTDETDPTKPILLQEPIQTNTKTFSLAKFIPLLKERIYVINPFARMFLVSWIALLDSIPDLELITYLPQFLGGLLSFLSDPSKDVRIATHSLLYGFLQEIKRIAEIKQRVADMKKARELEETENKKSDDKAESGLIGNEAQTQTQTHSQSEQESSERNDCNEKDIIEKGMGKGNVKDSGIQKKPQEKPQEKSTGGDVHKQEHGSDIISKITDKSSTQQVTDKHSDSVKPDSELAEPLSHLSLGTPVDNEKGNQRVDNVTGSVNSHVQVEGVSETSDGVAPDSVTANEPNVDAQKDNYEDKEAQQIQQPENPEESDDDIDDEDEESAFYIPGQDVVVNYDKIIEILISHLDSSAEDIQLTVLSWIQVILEVSPYSLLPYAPRFLSVLLPAIAYDGSELRQAAEKVNQSMLKLIQSLPDDSNSDTPKGAAAGNFSSNNGLDYSSMVSALTLHFLNEKEETRTGALDWLIMLHNKVPKKILVINDGTFPALLKTLSDPSEQVVTRDLRLLAQISYNSDDEYFTVFMVHLLKLFSTDRGLLETRGNLIIRQLCLSLNPERIYRTLAEILENDDDVEFASIMVQNLNNNFISAPELSGLRVRLRRLDTKQGSSLFVVLFKSWCYNSVAALSLCLLAQAYEHAFQVLQIIVEFDITVALLVQIDKLVQLLESPVFTQLRLQLLEPEKYPYLYKCLYGILMILPQSTAFNTLKNRLNSVSAIGYVHLPLSKQQPQTQLTKSHELETQWKELLDKFRQIQSKLQTTRLQSVSSNSFGGLKGLGVMDSFHNNIDSKLLTESNHGSAGSGSGSGGTATGTSAGSGGDKAAKDASTKTGHVIKEASGSKDSPVRRFSKGPFSLRKSEDKKR